MNNKEFYKNVLLELKQQVEEIEAAWDGEGGGKLEENAHLSHEIMVHIDQILENLDTLN